MLSFIRTCNAHKSRFPSYKINALNKLISWKITTSYGEIPCIKQWSPCNITEVLHTSKAIILSGHGVTVYLVRWNGDCHDNQNSGQMEQNFCRV
jgi:hypothetical protein